MNKRQRTKKWLKFPNKPNNTDKFFLLLFLASQGEKKKRQSMNMDKMYSCRSIQVDGWSNAEKNLKMKRI